VCAFFVLKERDFEARLSQGDLLQGVKIRDPLPCDQVKALLG
jgi:hypothetical protein